MNDAKWPAEHRHISHELLARVKSGSLDFVELHIIRGAIACIRCADAVSHALAGSAPAEALRFHKEAERELFDWCLSERTLSDWLLGDLDPPLAHAVAEHVSVCELCHMCCAVLEQEGAAEGAAGLSQLSKHSTQHTPPPQPAEQARELLAPVVPLRPRHAAWWWAAAAATLIAALWFTLAPPRSAPQLAEFEAAILAPAGLLGEGAAQASAQPLSRAIRATTNRITLSPGESVELLVQVQTQSAGSREIVLTLTIGHGTIFLSGKAALPAAGSDQWVEVLGERGETIGRLRRRVGSAAVQFDPTMLQVLLEQVSPQQVVNVSVSVEETGAGCSPSSAREVRLEVQRALSAEVQEPTLDGLREALLTASSQPTDQAFEGQNSIQQDPLEDRSNLLACGMELAAELEHREGRPAGSAEWFELAWRTFDKTWRASRRHTYAAAWIARTAVDLQSSPLAGDALKERLLKVARIYERELVAQADMHPADVSHEPGLSTALSLLAQAGEDPEVAAAEVKLRFVEISNWRIHAQAARWRGDNREAEESLQRATAAAEAAAVALSRAATAASSDGASHRRQIAWLQWNNAELLLQRALVYGTDALGALALARESLTAHSSVDDHLESPFARKQRMSAAHRLLAQCLAAAGQWDEAIQTIDIAVSLAARASSLGLALSVRAHILAAKGENAQAAEAAAGALRALNERVAAAADAQERSALLREPAHARAAQIALNAAAAEGDWHVWLEVAEWQRAGRQWAELADASEPQIDALSLDLLRSGATAVTERLQGRPLWAEARVHLDTVCKQLRKEPHEWFEPIPALELPNLANVDGWVYLHTFGQQAWILSARRAHDLRWELRGFPLRESPEEMSALVDSAQRELQSSTRPTPHFSHQSAIRSIALLLGPALDFALSGAVGLGRTEPERTLLAIPSGPLNDWPWAALPRGPRGERWLGEGVTVVQAPSLAAAVRAHHVPVPAQIKKIAHLAKNDFRVFAATLEEEREAIVRALGGDAVQVRGGEMWLDGEWLDAHALHLRGHGVWASSPPSSPWTPGGRQRAVCLAGCREGEAELLTAATLLRGPVVPAVAVMSVCAAAAPESRSAIEVSSLAGALLTKGAHAVIAPLWDVQEESALRFAEGVYRAMAQGSPPCAAVRRAATEMRDLGAPPRTWAPYVCVGAP